jgi:SH3-like domain-containing protein
MRLLSLGLFIALLSIPATAQDNTRRIVEPVPASTTQNLYRVSADQTPSGFIVPRYVSLKFGKVNARTGPSRQHAIAYQYQRRGLPVMVVAETEMWRKIRDIQGDEAWVRKSALSGNRFTLATRDSSLRSKPRADSRETARTEAQALLRLERCDDAGWCLVRSEAGLKGWIRKADLWGAGRP